MNKNNIKKILNPKKSSQHKESLMVTFLWAFICAVAIRSFLFEPFHIPSSSMYPNLLIGDYIFVNKYSYGYSRYSFPLGLNLFDDRIFFTAPKRGDMVVFRLPSKPSVNYVKRLIGLPGDKIQMRDGVLYINDQEVRKTFSGEAQELENDKIITYKKYQETLPEGKIITTYDRDLTLQDNTGVYVVPPKHYFMMGDNRDDSQDSRFLNLVGFIPEQNLVGRASMIFFSNSQSIFDFSAWLKSIRYQRIGNKLNSSDINE